jgi:6-pyruvoyltetrahydropterin/6-carboxytetrahydropterin synthase
LHGYAVQVTLNFCTTQDNVGPDGWVVDYGGLKEIKQWLADNFDHKTLVAKSDPYLNNLKQMHDLGIIDMIEVEEIGTENFARMIYDHVSGWLRNIPNYDAVWLRKVEVREHNGNAAYVENRSIPTTI